MELQQTEYLKRFAGKRWERGENTSNHDTETQNSTEANGNRTQKHSYVAERQTMVWRLTCPGIKLRSLRQKEALGRGLLITERLHNPPSMDPLACACVFCIYK